MFILPPRNTRGEKSSTFVSTPSGTPKGKSQATDEKLGGGESTSSSSCRRTSGRSQSAQIRGKPSLHTLGGLSGSGCLGLSLSVLSAYWELVFTLYICVNNARATLVRDLSFGLFRGLQTGERSRSLEALAGPDANT